MKTIAALLLSFSLALPATAQVVESIDVHVLEVEATVVDANGRAVSGLTADDFVVTVDGKPAVVTNFYAVQQGRQVDASVPLEAARQIPMRVTIFFDDAHLTALAKVPIARALRRYLETSLDSTATASIVRWNNSMTVVVPPTRDREKLLAGVDTMLAQMPQKMPGAQETIWEQMGEAGIEGDVIRAFMAGAAEIERVQSDQTAEVMMELIRAASVFDGRRVLLYVSHGGLPTSQQAVFRELVWTAQRAGVAISVLGAGTNDLRKLSEETGGSVVRGLSLEKMAEQITTYYSLGVRAPSTRKSGFAIGVSLRDRPDLRVVTASRRGIIPPNEALNAAVRSRLHLRETENPLDVRAALLTPRRHRGQCVATVQVAVPSTKLALIPAGKMEVRFAVLDERGQESEVRLIEKDVRPSPGDFVRETVTLQLQPKHQYVLSVGVTDAITRETSYIQTDVDARECK